MRADRVRALPRPQEASPRPRGFHSQVRASASGAPTPALRAAAKSVDRFLARRRTARTDRIYAAYESDFRAFCALHDVSPLPALPAVVQAFGMSRPDLHANSIFVMLCAVRAMHLDAGFADPTRHRIVRQFRKDLARTAECRIVAPIDVDAHARPLLATLDPSLRMEARTGAVLTILLATGATFTDISRMERSVVFEEGRMLLTSRPPYRRRLYVYAGADPVTCPLRWMKAWLALAPPTPGPLFVARYRPDVPMGYLSLYHPLQAFLKRANIGRRIGTRNVRRTVALEACERYPVVAVAEQMGYGSLQRFFAGMHVPRTRRRNHWADSARRAGRR